MTDKLPYKISTLCFLFDERERLLLLHRAKEPNKGLYSPIGGKLKMDEGESPGQCAIREIYEEVGISVGRDEIHLTGMVSEKGYGNETHWLMFLYEVIGPRVVERMVFEEGKLEWHELDEVELLAIPETDRRVIYPLFREYRGRFFHAHIDCTDDAFEWHIEHPAPLRERE